MFGTVRPRLASSCLYFTILHLVNYTYAAVTAIAVANLILIAFVLISVLEDNRDAKKIEAAKTESKKNK